MDLIYIPKNCSNYYLVMKLLNFKMLALRRWKMTIHAESLVRATITMTTDAPHDPLATIGMLRSVTQDFLPDRRHLAVI